VNSGVQTDQGVEARTVRVSADITPHPFSFTLRRDGRRLLGPVAIRAWTGSADDQFIGLSEGLVAMEELDDPVAAVELRGDALIFADGSRGTLQIESHDDHVRIEVTVPEPFHRVALVAPGHPEQRFSGLGARHGLHVDQAGRLGGDRRARRALRARRRAADLHPARGGPAERATAHAVHAGRRLRAFLRLTGMPAVLPEWAYGHWKSRDVYEHQRDVEDDFDGYLRNRLPLDAIVLDSPSRPDSATRPSANARWRRRSGASRRAAAPRSAWPTGPWCGGRAGSGR